jgi:hypothetical protein
MSKLKHREPIRLYLFFTVLCLLLAILYSIASSAAYTQQQNRLDRYGEWQAAILKSSESTKAAVLQHAAIQAVGEIAIAGEVYSPSGTFCCNIGTIDDTGKLLGRLHLFEGNWPSQPDDIVLEYSTLGYLNYSYDLGQQIKLDVTYIGADGKKHVQTEKFRLSGILPSYAANWENGVAVSGIVNDNSVLLELPGVYKNLLIKGSYNPVKEITELQKLQNEKETFVFNNGAYPASLTGLANFSENGMADVLLAIIAFAFIGCAAQTYMLRRRNEIFILWMLGAPRAEHLRHYLRRFIKCWAISCLIGTLIGLQITRVAAALTEQLKFSFPPTALIKFVLIEFAALLIGVIFPILAGLRSGSDEEKTGLPITRVACLRGKKFSFQRIYCSAHAKQVFLWVLLPLIATAAVNMVFFSGFQNYSRNIHDDIPEEPDFSWGSSGQTGMSERSLQQLWSTEGIEMVDGESVIDCDDLYWYGFEKSNYVKVYRNNVREQTGSEPEDSTLGWSINGLDSDSSWTQWLLSQVEDASHLQNDEFEDQNTIILCLPTVASNGEDGWDFYKDGDYLSSGTQIVNEDTVQVGDVINLVIYGNTYKLLVSGIVRSYKENDRYGFRVCTGSEAFISRDTAARLLGGKVPDYNSVSAYLQENADGELTAKLVSRIDSAGMPFENRFEDKVSRRESVLVYLVFCIAMEILIFLIYIMLAYVSIQNALVAEEEKLKLIQDLGGDEGKMLRKGIVFLFLFCLFCTVLEGAFFLISTCLLPSLSAFIGEHRMPLLYAITAAIRVWSPSFPTLLYAVMASILAVLPSVLFGIVFYRKFVKTGNNRYTVK